MSVPPPLPPLPPHDPYAAPRAVVTEVYDNDLLLADRGIRLVAAIVDGVIYLVIGLFAGVLLPMLADRSGNEAVAMAVALLSVLAFLVVLGINIVWLHRYGQSIGKRIFGIRIVRTDGSPCSLLRVIFARWLPVTLLGAIPLVGYIVSLADPLMIFRSDYRCLHDLIADTIVVKA